MSLLHSFFILVCLFSSSLCATENELKQRKVKKSHTLGPIVQVYPSAGVEELSIEGLPCEIQVAPISFISSFKKNDFVAIVNDDDIAYLGMIAEEIDEHKDSIKLVVYKEDSQVIKEIPKNFIFPILQSKEQLALIKTTINKDKLKFLLACWNGKKALRENKQNGKWLYGTVKGIRYSTSQKKYCFVLESKQNIKKVSHKYTPLVPRKLPIKSGLPSSDTKIEESETKVELVQFPISEVTALDYYKK